MNHSSHSSICLGHESQITHCHDFPESDGINQWLVVLFLLVNTVVTYPGLLEVLSMLSVSLIFVGSPKQKEPGTLGSRSIIQLGGGYLPQIYMWLVDHLHVGWASMYIDYRLRLKPPNSTAWWFGTFFIFHILQLTFIFFRGGGIPPTSLDFFLIFLHLLFRRHPMSLHLFNHISSIVINFNSLGHHRVSWGSWTSGRSPKSRPCNLWSWKRSHRRRR